MKFGSSRELVVDGQNKEVQLRAVNGSEIVTCRVSRVALETLVSRERVGVAGLRQIAYHYFELLTEKWAHRIDLGIGEIDGSVLLRRSDMLAEITGSNHATRIRVKLS